MDSFNSDSECSDSDCSDSDCSDSDCSDSDCIVTVVTVLLQVVKWARTKDKFR